LTTTGKAPATHRAIRSDLAQFCTQRDDPAVLLEEGILFPAEAGLEKLIAQVRPQAEQHVFSAITRQLTPTQRQALENLLLREQGKRGSTLA
jgi:hypothetical protein